MKKILLFVFLIVGAGAAAGAYLIWDFAVSPASNRAEEITLDVPPGSTFRTLRGTLAAQGLRIPEFQTRAWNAITQASLRLHAGEYVVDTSDSAHTILKKVLEGPAKSHRLIVREGNNIWDIQSALRDSRLDITPEAYQKWIRDPKRLARMGVPKIADSRVEPTLEGFLFPETYTYYKYHSAESLLESMLVQFEKRIKPLLTQHPWGATPEGRYKLLILASIVEKESGDVKEQPMVASVYWNRIRKGMRLQADPTTIYGLMPSFDGNLRRVHLLADAPYNTYKMKGLPPTPIANPGESAVRAVLNPASTKYLFFVSRNDGTHVFSEDYATHDRYVNEFQRNRRSTPKSTPPANNKR